jgi:hypothetical protein
MCDGWHRSDCWPYCVLMNICVRYGFDALGPRRSCRVQYGPWCRGVDSGDSVEVRCEASQTLRAQLKFPRHQSMYMAAYISCRANADDPPTGIHSRGYDICWRDVRRCSIAL